MIAIPRLDGVRAAYGTVGMDRLAALCALQLAERLPSQPPRSSLYLEQATLAAMLERWLEEQCRGMRVHDPIIKVITSERALEPFDEQDGKRICIHVGNRRWDCWSRSQWHLQRRWQEIERAAPGLARTALCIVTHAAQHGLPVFTPGMAGSYAERFWDWNEEMAAEGEENPDALTRADFHAAIPVAVSRECAELRGPALARIARRRDDIGRIAERVIELTAATAREHRRKKRTETLFCDASGGYESLGYAAVLRWNGTDPMERIFHDYGQSCADSEGYNEAYFCSLIGPEQMRDWMFDMERRFELARMVDGLVPLIATRAR